MWFVKPVGYITSNPILWHKFGMRNFRVEITRSGTQREKEDIRRLISKEISYEKVLILLM